MATVASEKANFSTPETESVPSATVVTVMRLDRPLIAPVEESAYCAVSVPAPPVRLSLPAPPLRMSAPAPPSTESSPPRATTVSAPAPFVWKASAFAEPSTVTVPERFSRPSPAPVAPEATKVSARPTSTAPESTVLPVMSTPE